MGKQVTIIGAGIVGISTAIWLQRYGCSVTLIDRQIAKQAASYGNAGILAACSVVPVTVPGLLRKSPNMLLNPDQPLFLKWSYLLTLVPWLRRYLAHCNVADVERIAKALTPLASNTLADHQALAQGTPAAEWVKPDDYLFLYDNRQAFENDAFGWDIRRKNGYTWEEITGDAVSEYDPHLAGGERLLIRFDDHGRIASPGHYLQALTDYAIAQGATLMKGEVADFVKDGNRVTGVKLTDDRVVDADAVAITTGVWSSLLTDKLGLRVPLESERGYHLELIEPSIRPRSPIMIASGKFVMTPMDYDNEKVLRLAGIVEFGGLKAEASQAAHELLRKKVKQALPGLTWQSERAWLGHRPAPSDSIPLIGGLDAVKGLFMGFGHHHIGLTCGPKTGQLLAQLITEQPTDIDLQPYKPERFI